jgi:hypothetical protein
MNVYRKLPDGMSPEYPELNMHASYSKGRGIYVFFKRVIRKNEGGFNTEGFRMYGPGEYSTLAFPMSRGNAKMEAKFGVFLESVADEILAVYISDEYPKIKEILSRFQV